MRSYPLSAVPGNEKAKTALLLLCINPRIGSVLLLGKKGSGKTTLLQSIKDLIVGELADSSKCVDLPSNITLDRLLGGISLEHAIGCGEKKAEKGILSLANSGFLFIDQINLLPDPILNNLFSAQEHRLLILEREGIGHEEDLSFSFFAAANGEDPALSAAHLDHIGISVFLDEEEIAEEAGAETDSAKAKQNKADGVVLEKIRVEKMKRMMDFERDPFGFCSRYADATEDLNMQISDASSLLPRIRLREEDFSLVSDLVEAAGCPGHRAEIVLCEVARAIAAYRGRTTVLESDLIEAAGYTLPHRMNRPRGTVDFSTFSREVRGEGEGAEDSEEDVRDFKPERGQSGNHRPGGAEMPEERTSRSESSGSDAAECCAAERGAANDCRDDSKDAGTNFAPPDSGCKGGCDVAAEGKSISIFSRATATKKEKSLGYGRRRRLVTHLDRGREVGSLIPRNGVQDLSMMATLRAAAMDHRPPDFNSVESVEPSAEAQRRRGSPDFAGYTDGPDADFVPHSGPLLKIRPEHLREKKKESTGGARILFLVDGSASMGAYRRMALVRRVVFSILGDSYVHRDFVAVMVFKGRDARTVLPFTRSMERAKKCLEALRTGGRTPLISALWEALRFLKLDAVRHKNPRYELVLVSDGKNNVLPEHADLEGSLAEIRKRLDSEQVGMSVIDTESGFMRFGYAKTVSEKLGAQYFSIDKWKRWM